MPYVFSTLSNENMYVEYDKGPNDMPIVKRKVMIAGGSNVVNKHLMTPMGLATKVSDEQLEMLEANPVFQLHKKNGFITVKSTNLNPEKVAADMTTRDQSAPLVPEDYNDNSRGKPVIGKLKKVG